MATEHKTIDCELCVLGTGIAGLNALYAASYYLAKGTRVVVIDQNSGVGGMWRNTYPYVRLHQPHPFFTVGDMKWALQKEPSYLASRSEVLDHLADCYARIKQHFQITELFSSYVEQHREHAEGVVVDVATQTVPVQVHAKRLIKAKGLNVKTNTPFRFSSDKVASAAPEQLDLNQHADKPVYIVGGGKTAMDTAHEIIRQQPGRPVHMIVGKGTWFVDRAVIAPTGLRRWFKGLPLTRFNMLIAECFDGTNANACRDLLKRLGAVALQNDFEGFLLGLLSQGEHQTIKEGVASVITNYLEDVVENDGVPTLIFKNGESMAIEEGALVVNCSGYIVRDMPEPEPFLSAGKRVLSIQSTSSTIIFSTFDAYFLTHMYFREKLEKSGLCAVNFYAIDKQCKPLVSYVACTQMIYNLYIYLDQLPASVVANCHLNLDRWYPKHRQLWALAQLLWQKRTLQQHCREALNRFELAYEIPCQPLGITQPEDSAILAEQGSQA